MLSNKFAKAAHNQQREARAQWNVKGNKIVEMVMDSKILLQW